MNINEWQNEAHAKEALSLHDRTNLFAIHNEEDGRLQRAIEDIINLVDGITICLTKQM